MADADARLMPSTHSRLYFLKGQTCSLDEMCQLLQEAPFAFSIIWAVKGETLTGQVGNAWTGKHHLLDSLEIQKAGNTGLQVRWVWIDLFTPFIWVITGVLTLILLLLYATHSVSPSLVILVPCQSLFFGFGLKWGNRFYETRLVSQHLERVPGLSRERHL